MDLLHETCLSTIKSELSSEMHYNVVLQFSDDFSPYADTLYQYFTNTYPKITFFILGIPHGCKCCVDFLSASQINSSLIIYFGHLFLDYHCSQENQIFSSIKLLLVSKKSIDIFDETIKNIVSLERNKKFFIYSAEYPVIEFCSKYNLKKLSPQNLLEYFCNSLQENYGLIFLGSNIESPAYSRISTLFSLSDIYIVHSEGNFSKISPSTKPLSTRFSKINLSENASTFGLLLENCNNSFLTELLISLIKLLGKNYQVFSNRQVSSMRLGNFSEIDCFINLGCHNRIFVNYSYHIPIVSVSEFLLSCPILKNKLEAYFYLDDSVIKNLNIHLIIQDYNLSEARELMGSNCQLSFDKYSLRSFKGIGKCDFESSDMVIEEGLSGYSIAYKHESNHK